jgi:hypothetical protein
MADAGTWVLVTRVLHYTRADEKELRSLRPFSLSEIRLDILKSIIRGCRENNYASKKNVQMIIDEHIKLCIKRGLCALMFKQVHPPFRSRKQEVLESEWRISRKDEHVTNGTHERRQTLV